MCLKQQDYHEVGTWTCWNAIRTIQNELHPQFYGIDVSLIVDSQKKCVTCSNEASISLSNWCLGEWVEELGYSAQNWIDLLFLKFLTAFGNFLTS